MSSTPSSKSSSLPSLPVVKVQETTLPNGLRIVTAALPHHARCHVFAQLKGGPVHETDQTWGLSHVVEHMVFRGTKRHKDARAVGLCADDFGGDMGAATYRDRITFDTRVDPDRVEDALALLGEMLGSPRFEGLKTELSIIESELDELYDDDGQEIDVDNMAFRQLFSDHVLSRSIEGPPQRLKKIEKSDLQRFHKAFFGAGNLVVSVAGPVRHHDVVAAATAALGHLATGTPAPVGTPPKVHAPHNKRDVIVRTDDGQTDVRLSFKTVGFSSTESAVASMLARIIDDGPASRLQQEIIDRDGLAYAAWAMSDLYLEHGCFELAAQVRHDRVLALVEALVGQLQAIATRAPTAAELNRVVRRAARDQRDMLDAPDSLAEAVGKAVLFGQPFAPATSLARLEAVTGSQVRNLAKALLREPRLTLVGLPRKADVKKASALITAVSTTHGNGEP